MRFVKLTRPDGRSLWMSDAGVLVEEEIGEENPGRTRLTIGGVVRFVEESVMDVLSLLEVGLRG